jgi:hypothetical protein
LNPFPYLALDSNDTQAELELVQKYALNAGADQAVPSNHWAKGGEGAIDLANAVIKACEEDNDFHYLCAFFALSSSPCLSSTPVLGGSLLTGPLLP